VNYTHLMHGDHLPMVGVLQLLLNRSGDSLDPDGHFGPKTLQAVTSFQRRNGLAADGIVGEKTWAAITADVNLPIVDAIDVWDPTFFREDAAFVRKVGGHPYLIGGMCNGVQQMVSDICKLASGNAFLLRLHGHGGPGVASVASGHGELDPKMRERSDVFDNKQVMQALAPLRSIFGPYGSIEFIECETGRGTKGRRLLSHLAAQIGVPVTAALNDQPFGRTATFRLYGPTVTMVPRGHLRDWCRSLPAFRPSRSSSVAPRLSTPGWR